MILSYPEKEIEWKKKSREKNHRTLERIPNVQFLRIISLLHRMRTLNSLLFVHPPMFRISLEVLIRIDCVESIDQRTSNLIVATNVDGLDYRMFCDYFFFCYKSGMWCGSARRIIISKDEVKRIRKYGFAYIRWLADRWVG